MSLTKFKGKASVIKAMREYIELDEQMKELEKQKKKLTEVLLPVIVLEGPLAWGDKKIERHVSGGRRPTREQIVARFGELGELFWEQLKPEHYEYLSVVPK